MPVSHTLYVSGMHCASCAALIEKKLSPAPGISAVKVFLHQRRVEVQCNPADETPATLMKRLQPLLAGDGFHLHETPAGQARWPDLAIAAALAAFFLGLVAAARHTGLIDFVDTTHMSYLTAFLVGLVASVSSCMVMVGGLTLSLSASYAREGQGYTPLLLFHAGRLLAFFLMGGVIAWLGHEIETSLHQLAAIHVLVGLVMLLLGLNLLDLFPAFRRLQPILPDLISPHLSRLKQPGDRYAPLLLGAATFFMPCGFAQSMQLYAMTTGSFAQGACLMLAFAVGTLPALALLSFAPWQTTTPRLRHIFFKTAGLIIIAFALVSLRNALIALGMV